MVANKLSHPIRQEVNMSNPRVFISFAVEDTYARDFLVQQAKDNRSPFEFTDMSVKEPWSNSWKTQCRSRIKGCDGVIALISKKTRNADGARWEIQCADEEGIPMLGVRIHADDKGAIPPELQGYKVIEWSWPGIASFINSLK
jgi:hypothetical protein